MSLNKVSLRRETLIYLAGLPDEIQKNPERAYAILCISLGNYLKWVSPMVDEGEKPIRPRIGFEAKSLLTLGERFREIGLENFNKKPASPSWEREFSEIHRRLDLLIGGGK